MNPTKYVKKLGPYSGRLWKSRFPLIRHLDIELTERCNNNCIHCCINLPETDRGAKSHELDTSRWQRIIKEAADIGVLTVRFTGGEPLLRNDFSHLYQFTRKLGMKVRLCTNATLITESLAEMFFQIPPLEKIEVSVYGMQAKSYEAVTRNPGSFEKFRNGIDLLLKNKIPFIVKGILLPNNEHEIKIFESWAATLPNIDHSPSYSYLFNLRTRHDSSRKNRVIKKLRPNPEEAVAFMVRNKEQFDRDMRQFCDRFLGPPGDKLLNCGAGYMVNIDAFGILQPCLLLRHPEFGIDLEHQGLKEALYENLKRIKKAIAKNPDYLERCAKCFLKSLCQQCPAKSWTEHGTLDTPVEYFCQIAHAQARHLGLLEKGEMAWEVSNWQARIENMRGN